MWTAPPVQNLPSSSQFVYMCSLFLNAVDLFITGFAHSQVAQTQSGSTGPQCETITRIVPQLLHLNSPSPHYFFFLLIFYTRDEIRVIELWSSSKLNRWPSTIMRTKDFLWKKTPLKCSKNISQFFYLFTKIIFKNDDLKNQYIFYDHKYQFSFFIKEDWTNFAESRA